MKFLLALLASLYSSLLLVGAYEVLSQPDGHLPQEQFASSPKLLDSEPLTEHGYLSLMKFLMRHNNKQQLQQQQQQHQAAAVPMQKRYGVDFGMPYLKYDKRNNGVWIWMPAQGYVSVPREQQAGDMEGDGKQGKIMRYGK